MKRVRAWIGMTKLPELDGYTRNPTQMGQVYSIPDEYWTGYEISFKISAGMGLVDTQPNYPKPHIRLPELYT
ncbi:hypothetical protein Hanom_Chr06g00478881 [Helianthus anomalus]